STGGPDCGGTGFASLADSILAISSRGVDPPSSFGFQMSSTPPPPAADAPRPRPPLRLLAALLSFCVPGLGQIVQGAIGKNPARLAKGVFFMVALLGMFFYGQWLGDWRAVYLAHYQEAMLEAPGRDGKQPLRWPWPANAEM